MTTQTEAERLADQLEDPVNAKLYLAPYIAAELRRLVSFINDLKDEVVEQCRINGMSAEREDALRAEVDRLNKALTWEQNRAERIGTHGPGCHTWGPSHYECLLRVNAELVEALKELVYETETVSIGDYSEEAHDIAVSKARAALAKLKEKNHG
jgi:hypothetical protein